MTTMKTGRAMVRIAVRSQLLKWPRIASCCLASDAISCLTQAKGRQISTTMGCVEERHRLSEAIEYP